MKSDMNRRTILAGAAAAIPATAIPALALASGAGPDPVFAAIEAYKTASAFHCECLDKADALDGELRRVADEKADREAPEGIALRKVREGAEFFGVARLPEDDPRYIAFREAEDAYLNSRHFQIYRVARNELCEDPRNAETARLRHEGADAQRDAAWEMAECVPTTRAGALAIMRLYIEEERRDQCLQDYVADFGDIGSVTGTRSWSMPSIILTSVAEYLEGEQAAYGRLA